MLTRPVSLFSLNVDDVRQCLATAAGPRDYIDSRAELAAVLRTIDYMLVTADYAACICSQQEIRRVCR